jgi:hypothetical protein
MSLDNLVRICFKVAAASRFKIVGYLQGNTAIFSHLILPKA